MSTLNYKLLKEDNYDNLSKRFGTTLLANAGIFGDEDLTPGSTLSFTNLKDDEIKLILDRTQQYLNLVNRNRELSYIKKNRDYIDRENFWLGNNSHGKSDEELLSTYKGTVAAAKQEEKDRAVQAEKSRIAVLNSKDKAEHNARLRSQGVENEETMRFSPEMRYHEGRKQLIESTGNTHNPMLRGVTLNGNTDTSFEGSLQNIEDQAKLGEEIKDMTLKAATGVVGLAGATALAPVVAPTLSSISNSQVGMLGRSIAGSELARSGAEKAGLNKNYQTAASYLGGGFAGLSNSLMLNGARAIMLEGLSDAIGIAAADQTGKALENTSNYIKYPVTMLAGFFGRRGFNGAIRGGIKNTKWGEDMILRNKNNSASVFSTQGHVQPVAENIKGTLLDESKQLSEKGIALLKNGFIYGGALAMKALPMIGTGLGVAGALDIVDNYTDNELVKESMNYAIPFITNKMYGTYQNFNRGNALFLTYGSGGTGKGMKSAMQNVAKIALNKPKLVNKELRSALLSKPELIKGLSIAAWDALPIHYRNGKFGRIYKPGGYGFTYYTTKGNQGGDWGNLNASGYVGNNPISHMYSGTPLGKGVQSSGQHVRLGKPKNNLIDNIAQRLFPKGSGYDVRYGDRPIEVVFAGNKVDLSKGKFAKSFDRRGNVTEWTTNPSEAKVRHTNYNVDTGHRVKLNNKTQNLTVNTKGLQTMVYQDPDGNIFSIGGDLYGVGSGKTNLFSSMYGAYMDAHTNPIITLSANKYTPTKTKGTQSFGSEVFTNLPHYKQGGIIGFNNIGL